MKTPKLLPWYARKAGVPIVRATTLWRTAICEATEKTGWVGNTEYWGEAMHTFIALLEREQSTFCAPCMTPLWRSHNRLWQLPLIAMEDILAALSASWQRQLNAPPRRTA